MQKKTTALLVAAGMAMSGCGGGGGGGVASTPPPPPPPPPPTTASYAVFPTPNETFQTVAFGMGGNVQTTTVNGVTRVSGLTPDPNMQVGPGTNNYTITPTGSGVYVLDIFGFGGPAISTTSADARFDAGSTSAGTDILEVAKNDVPIDLTYTGFGNYTSIESTGRGYISYFVAGQPTASGDMPTSGSASYGGIADGVWYDGSTVRRLYGSNADLSVDFATGSLTSTLNLVGHGDPFGDFASAPTKTLGTFTGQGTLSSSSFFSGDYIATNGYSGSFDGSFFGPTAAEFGLSFGLGNGSGGMVSGIAVGTKH